MTFLVKRAIYKNLVFKTHFQKLLFAFQKTWIIWNIVSKFVLQNYN